MSSPIGEVPTRVVDLSGLSLIDVQHRDDAELVRAGGSLVQEVVDSVVVSASGSDS
jgi:hypothetical protein